MEEDDRIRIAIVGGTLQLDIAEILEEAIAHHPEIVERLACDDAVIRHVADQILDGYTESGSYGSTCCIAGDEPYTPLDKARARVVAGAGEVARREIERLRAELEGARVHYRAKLRAAQEDHEALRQRWCQHQDVLMSRIAELSKGAG